MVERIDRSIDTPRFFFTEPWEPLIVRRGDALGLGAIADRFAEAVVPDFSNRIRDGRWVTILAWCLVRSQQVFDASGGRSVATRAEQDQRYAWLRPLELMWVARTILLLERQDWGQRSLGGQRRVVLWTEKQSADRFCMSPEQFRSYRQTGMYGGYRLAFRKWPGMTMHGDGWTPDSNTKALAVWMNAKLKSAGLDLAEKLTPKSAKSGRGKEDRWWINHWKGFELSSKDADENTLPRPRGELNKVLPEADLIKPLIFGNDENGQKRLKVVASIKKSSATNHLELCKHLSSEFKDVPAIAYLYRFSRLADAGMAAMSLIAESLGDKPFVAINEVAQHKNAVEICKELKAAARAWGNPDISLRHIETANRFAGEMSSDQPLECLRSLIQYHEIYGGGLRWFALGRNGRVEPKTPPSSTASRYGFRLWSLCRLAVQCGVMKKVPSSVLRDETADLDLADYE